MANPPALDMQAFLQGLTLVDGATGWTSMVGYFPPNPDKIVSIHDTGGGAPEIAFVYEKPRLLFRVRGAVGEYSETYTKVMAIFDAVMKGDISAEYPVCFATQSPFFMEYDLNERPVWTMNVQLHRTRSGL